MRFCLFATLCMSQVAIPVGAEAGRTADVVVVPPGHADFAAVQWWGTRGGLHGLHSAPAKPGQRGKQILGQYYEAFPGHAVELDAVLTPELEGPWIKLALALGVPKAKCPPADGKVTRGDWIRAVYAARTR